MSLLKTLAAAAALSLVSLSAQAGDVTIGDLTLSESWTRATPPNAKAGGGFVTISNSGSESDRLVSAASETANRVEIHEMAIQDGIMKMREMDNGIEIPAGETVTLKPGGLHIMFMGLKGRFEEGTRVPVSLTFEKAGSVDIDLAVAPMGAKAMDHGKMNHSGHGKN
ncbi:MAG: copper chaperone PCu(A)C [Roseibium sp.]|nr:copper chaperone PCu(A)C [Roseibium sp.]